MQPAVKCPKCGFVNYPGAVQCKKCGHSFALLAPKEKSSGLLTLFSGLPPPAPPTATSPAAPSKRPTSSEPPRAHARPAQPPIPTTPWREELAFRVDNFRRRRARLKQSGDAEPSLNFEEAGELEGAPDIDAELSMPPTAGELDGSLAVSTVPQIDGHLVEPHPLEKAVGGMRMLTAAAVEAGELTIDHPALEAEPVEILVEPAAPPVVAPEVVPLGLPVATLGRRFLAGVADTLVLLAAAALFALVFWRAGGSLSRQPLNFLVLALTAGFFIFVYFGIFTALTATTPGLLWMGLEVRNFEGEFPTARESFWRAFGYLISITGLLLGFIWTLVDSERLSWHDRISNTFLTVSPGRA